MSDYAWELDPNNSEGWISDPFDKGGFQVPLSEIDDFPVRCVSISEEWVPIIVGLLDRLKYADMWEADASEMERVLGNINNLQAQFSTGGCPEGMNEYQCQSLPLQSPLVTWLPADPFDEPDKKPPGYLLPPWTVNQFFDPLNGLEPGDVVVQPVQQLLAFPPVIPASGVPRLQIHVQGPADVDIEFVQVPLGGVALIQVDGIPKFWVDLQLFGIADILNPTEWGDVFGFFIDTYIGAPTQTEISLDTPGPHVIEIQMFPRLTVGLNLGLGGGIRNIQICSSEEQIDLSSFVTDVQIVGGTVQKKVGGVWSNVANPDGADVLVESDLRGNGCALEFYDMLSGTWQKISNADFYNTLVNCNIQHSVDVLLADNNWSFRHIIPPSTVNMQYGSWNGGARVWGRNSAFLTTIFDDFMGWIGDNRAGVYSNGSAPLDDALFAIRSNTAKTPLSVWAAAAGTPNLAQFRRVDGTIVSELNLAGWFSAIQQLIVNDFSSTGARRGQGRVLGQWALDTDATRQGRLILQADDYNGVREGLRVEADGAFAKLGFFGNGAVGRQAVEGTTVLDALMSLISGFDQLGLISDATEISETEPYGGSNVIYDHWEAYWDMTLAEPSPDILDTYGTWYSTAGYVNETISGREIVSLTRGVTAHNEIVKIGVLVNVTTYDSAPIYISVEQGADPGTPLQTVQINGEVEQWVELDVQRRFSAGIYIVNVEGEVGDACAFQVKAIREIGRDFPLQDDVVAVTDLIVTTAIVDDFTLPV